MKVTCYPNSLDAHAARSAEPRTKEADGGEIKQIAVGDFFSFRDGFITKIKGL